MRLNRLSGVAAGIGASAGALVSTMAWAQDNLPVIGKPVDGAMGFQPAATSLASDLQGLDHMILYIITAIVIFVTALLIIVMVRFSQRANPNPRSFTHNTPLEIAWTLVPILILVFIGVFSLPVLFKQQEIPQGDITIKVTGNQWFWDYAYVDDGVTPPPAAGETAPEPLSFSSIMLAKEDLAANGYADSDYLLAVDNPVVLPVGKIIVMEVTGSDVIHSWKIPAFGVMQDAVPGRIAHLWFKPEKEGIYYGQCSELCGKDHSYMPIEVRVVSEEAYKQWLAKQATASLGAQAPVKFAAAD